MKGTAGRRVEYLVMCGVMKKIKEGPVEARLEPPAYGTSTPLLKYQRRTHRNKSRRTFHSYHQKAGTPTVRRRVRGQKNGRRTLMRRTKELRFVSR